MRKSMLSIWIFIFFVHFVHSQTVQNPELVVNTNHFGWIQSVTFNIDSKMMATGDGGGYIKLWDVATGSQITTFKAHKGVKFNVEDKPFWGDSKDISINLFERGNNFGRGQTVHSLDFSPDNNFLISGSSDKTIKIWDLRDSKSLIDGIAKITFNSPVRVWFVKYNTLGDKILSIGEDGSYGFWDVTNQSEIKDNKPNINEFHLPWQTSNGKLIAEYSEKQNDIRILDNLGKQTIYLLKGHEAGIRRVEFSPDDKLLASCGWDRTVRLWNQKGEQLKILGEHESVSSSLTFSKDGKFLVSVGWDLKIKLWNVDTGKEVKTFVGYGDSVNPLLLVQNDSILITAINNSINIWDLQKGRMVQNLLLHNGSVNLAAHNDKRDIFATSDETMLSMPRLIVGLVRQMEKNPNESIMTKEPRMKLENFISVKPVDSLGVFDKRVVSNNDIALWGLKQQNLQILSGQKETVTYIGFNDDGNFLVSGDWGGTIKIWSLDNKKKTVSILAHPKQKITYIGVNSSGTAIASVDDTGILKFWTLVESENNINIFPRLDPIKLQLNSAFVAEFSDDNSELIIFGRDSQNKLVDISIDVITGNLIKDEDAPKNRQYSFNRAQQALAQNSNYVISKSRKFMFIPNGIGKLGILNTKNDELLASLIFFNESDWAVVRPDGRFDTNKLENPKGLNWIVPDSLFKPLSFEIFMRQYYEPNLLPRLLKCTQEENCDKEFKSLPPIADLNRTQPKVDVKEIKPVQNSAGAVNVMIEVENVTEDISISSVDRTKKKSVSSGVFDLRLFRDGQLIGVSAPKEKLEKFIADAPRLVAETKASEKLINTPEDVAWREANDIFTLKGENVKRISPTKIQYTFRNVKLPRDGRESVEFTAYAFNSDKVKSATTEAVKFTIPKTIQPKKPRAVLISIGVNASENPAYDLRYAANDARKMQEIVGARLQAENAKYSEIVQIPLISDYKTDKTEAVNHAQKVIIKGVFALLEGKSFNDVETEISKINPKLTDVFKSVPNIEKLKQIEPEDTLIITYAGHGYADNAGIFYLLPSDIGKNTTKLTTENLRKMISSDELSLWMQDITAAEMILIIDACHSSAAVQGDGFKPGPMASRGLGQLSYDKDMKILSATQADNVAIESNCLEEGILSYALLKDGITGGLADANKDRKLFAEEWLSYAEGRVPELYQEVKDEKRRVIIDGKCVFITPRDIIYTGNSQKSNLDLQQPTLFDFKRRNIQNLLFNLP